MNLNARHSLFASMLIALGLTIGLGLVEIAVRIFDLAPALPDQYSAFAPDPVLPWRLNPNAIREGKTAEFHYRYEHNAVGFRDRDRKLNKDPGTFRIVGIGDSFTYGIGAGADSTFLAQIETTLNRRGKVEVINLGIPRYWPDPEALVLEHYGLHYQPDLVLVGVLPNDFLDTRIGTNIRSEMVTSYRVAPAVWAQSGSGSTFTRTPCVSSSRTPSYASATNAAGRRPNPAWKTTRPYGRVSTKPTIAWCNEPVAWARGSSSYTSHKRDPGATVLSTCPSASGASARSASVA